ncbi:WbuC family cupin fold metalloprotein [Providencia manganoxydans]|uniref:WbuC family cupin fold metalloprotein n=1 Tax=Providencia manganoxydans TaxID=2923283 RepID=UPI0029298938|nr:WbuC family cupin fold metalloprotein [Providencia rettgeri]
MQYIDTQTIEELYFEAKNNPRRRTHFLLHKSHQEKVQRLLIAFIKGSFVEPHLHELSHQWEMLFVLEGTLELRLHNFKGEILQKNVIGENSTIKAIVIQPNEIHSLICLSEKALILEVKEGPFDSDNPKKLLNT